MKVTDVKRNTCLLYNLTKCTACLQRVACTNHIFVRYKSHYDVLGLPRNASQKDIRDAYIKLSKKLHPDQNQEDKSSHQKFVKVQEAYEILSKEASRNHYDSLHNRRDQPIKSYPANRSSQRPPHYYSSGQNFTDNNYYSDPRSQQSRQGDPFSFYGYEQNQRQRNNPVDDVDKIYTKFENNRINQQFADKISIVHFFLLVLPFLCLFFYAIDTEDNNLYRIKDDFDQINKNRKTLWIIIICLLLPSFLHAYIRIYIYQRNMKFMSSVMMYDTDQRKHIQMGLWLLIAFIFVLSLLYIYIKIRRMTVRFEFDSFDEKEINLDGIAVICLFIIICVFLSVFEDHVKYKDSITRRVSSKLYDAQLDVRSRVYSKPKYRNRQERIAKQEEQRKRLEMAFWAFFIVLVIFVLRNILYVEIPFINKYAEEEYETPVTSLREKYNFTIESVFKYSFCVLMVMFAVLLGFLAQEYYIGYNLQAEIEDMEAEAWESGRASYEKALLYLGFYITIIYYLGKKEIERKAEMKKKKESSSEVTQFKDS